MNITIDVKEGLEFQDVFEMYKKDLMIDDLTVEGLIKMVLRDALWDKLRLNVRMNDIGIGF